MLVIIFYFKDSDLEVDSLGFRATQEPAFLARLPRPTPNSVKYAFGSFIWK